MEFSLENHQSPTLQIIGASDFSSDKHQAIQKEMIRITSDHKELSPSSIEKSGEHGNSENDNYPRQLPGSRLSMIPRNSFVNINSLNLQNFHTSKLTWEQEFTSVYNELQELVLEEWKRLKDSAESSLETLVSFQKWTKSFGDQFTSYSNVNFPNYESEQWDIGQLFRKFMNNSREVNHQTSVFAITLSNQSKKLINFSKTFGEFTANLKMKHLILLKEFNKLNDDLKSKLNILQSSNENYIWHFHTAIFVAWKVWCQIKTMVKELTLTWKDLKELESDKGTLCANIIEEFWEISKNTFNIDSKGPSPHYYLFELREIIVPIFPESKGLKIIKFRCPLVDKVAKELILSEEGMIVILDTSQQVAKPETKLNLRGALVESRATEVYIGSTKLKFETEEKANEFIEAIGCV